MSSLPHSDHPAISPRQFGWAIGLLSIAVAVAYLNPFIGHWDSYDYMKYILTRQRSSLMLGRPYFTLYNVLLLEPLFALGLPRDAAYLVVKWVIVLFSGLTSLSVFSFFRRLVPLRAAMLGALLMALSPVFATYSGMIMTEIPMMLAVFGGLALFQRGLDEDRTPAMMVGAGLLGVAIGIREQAFVITPYLLLGPLVSGKLRDRIGPLAASWATGLCAASAGPLFLLLTDPQYWPTMKKWLAFMREQKGRHPIGWSNAAIWLKWLVVNQPVAVVASGFGLRRLWQLRRERVAALTFVAFSMVIALALIGYQDLLYSPRYLMIAIPGLCLAGGVALASLWERWPRRFLAGFAGLHLLCLIAGLALMWPYRPTFAKARSYHRRIAPLPANSVFVVGQYCPYIGYLKAVGYPQTWDVICPGWTWPRQRLAVVIDGYLKRGLPVYVDEDPHLWVGSRLQQDFADWRSLRDRYRCERIEGTLWRVHSRRRATR